MSNINKADDQAEIVDFRDTLNKIVEDQTKSYGRKNKPRDQEPSMFQILSWQDPANEPWNYNTKNKEILEASAVAKFTHKINKSSTNWVSENMDQFRKFAYSPEKKAAILDLHDPQKVLKKKTAPISDPYHGQEPPINQDILEPVKASVYLEELPTKPSDYIDKYAIKKIETLDDVLKVVESRDLNKNGELIPANSRPKAQKSREQVMLEEIKRKQEEEAEKQRQAEEEAAENELGELEEDVSIEKLDFTNVKSRILENKVRKARALDPEKEKDRLTRRLQRIQKLNQTTRWLPNSAFMTYFGKPAFENYGMGNINPVVGGTVYGHYLKSHNVNPQKGPNKPEFKQVYNHAEFAATSLPISQPEPPRKCKEEDRLNQSQVAELKARNPLFPELNADAPAPIVKPDLVNSLRFASEENTPRNSAQVAPKEKKPVNLRETLKNLSKQTRAIRQEGAKKREDAEKGKRGTSLAATRKSQQEEEITAKPGATTQSAKKDKAEARKEEVTKFTEKKMELEATSKSKAAADATTSVNLGAKKAAAPTATIQSQPKAVESPVKVGKAESSPEKLGSRVRFDDTNTTKLQSPKSVKTTEGFRAANYQAEEAPASSQVEKNRPATASTTGENGEFPKNYLFSLTTKETNPKYYKNVPAVWMSRIPRAGKKNPVSEDIKNIFSYE